MTTTKKTTRPAREKGTCQRTSTARALPAVPGATGTHPTPPAVAMISATRLRARRRNRRSSAGSALGALADQLVPLDLDDGHAREPAGLEAAAEIDHPVDLGRLRWCGPRRRTPDPRSGHPRARP